MLYYADINIYYTAQVDESVINDRFDTQQIIEYVLNMLCEDC